MCHIYKYFVDNRSGYQKEKEEKGKEKRKNNKKGE